MELCRDLICVHVDCHPHIPGMDEVIVVITFCCLLIMAMTLATPELIITWGCTAVF